jgi:hypothetical protein
MQHSGSSKPFSSSSAKDSLKTQIADGVYGTSDVPGFLAYFNGDAELTWLNAEQFWRGNPFAAAHLYNVGSITSDDLTESPEGKNWYAHDILSRLQGWNGWAGGCEKSRECKALGFQERDC